MTTVDESKLSNRIRARLAELRACNNIVSVTPIANLASGGVLCILVPGEQVAEEGGWAMPSDPTLFVIPGARPN